MRPSFVLAIVVGIAFAQQNSGNGRLPLEAVDPETAATVKLMRARRVETFAGSLADSYIYAPPNNITVWLRTLDANGKWPDVEIDYTSGCKAQRANWPAAVHWHRLFIMTAAWHNSIPVSDARNMTIWNKNKELRAAIGRGMRWWFQRDFQGVGCLDGGGTNTCPCDTKGLWNSNWFSNVIYVPKIVGRVCSFLADGNSLTLNETTACVKPMQRAFSTFRVGNIVGLGPITGANAVDIAAIGIDAGLMLADLSILDEAYGYVHKELVLKEKSGEDGIDTDGSFAQHGGFLLYAGNYGKDYINAMVAVEAAAINTKWSANDAQKNALSTLFEADRWMIYRNTKTKVLHWDFSALNRFISFPVADKQATAGLNLNLTQIANLGSAWNISSIAAFSDSLRKNKTSVNAGTTIGTKVFWGNDYVVTRGTNYVTSLKMYSTRTQNSECINNQNPFGFHLSDGAMYTYSSGSDYEDIAAAWDWSLIPGTTNYPGKTKLECTQTTFIGKEAFVGGTSDGPVGLAAMKYTHPIDGTLGWQKSWFFVGDNIQVVMINQITPGVRAVSVMDQKRRSGNVVIDDIVVAPAKETSIQASTLWHDNVGYSFALQDPKPKLVVRAAPNTGKWEAIGTSKQPPTTVNLFTAFVEHEYPDLVYAIYPGANLSTFKTLSTDAKLQVVQNDASASALYYPLRNQIFAVFWKSGKLNSIMISDENKQKQLSITSSSPVVMIYDINNDKLSVADPTQQLASVQIRLETAGDEARSDLFDIKLPVNGKAGSTVGQPANLATLPIIANNNQNAAEMTKHRLKSYLPVILSFILSLCMLF